MHFRELKNGELFTSGAAHCLVKSPVGQPDSNHLEE